MHMPRRPDKRMHLRRRRTISSSSSSSSSSNTGGGPFSLALTVASAISLAAAAAATAVLLLAVPCAKSFTPVPQRMDGGATARAFAATAFASASRIVHRRRSRRGLQHALPILGAYNSPLSTSSLRSAAAAAATAEEGGATAETETETGPNSGWVTVDWDEVDVRRSSAPPPTGAADATASPSPPSSSEGSARSEIDPYTVATYSRLRPTPSPLQPSPVELIIVRDRMVYVKRDDLLRLRGSHVSGNKARKVLALNELPVADFPNAVVSYGGPQSNAMVALAAVVHSKNLAFGGSGSGSGSGGGDGGGEGGAGGIDALGGDDDGRPSLEDLMTEEEVAELLRDRDEEDGGGGDEERGGVDAAGGTDGTGNGTGATVEREGMIQAAAAHDDDDDGAVVDDGDPTSKKQPEKIRFVYYTKKLPRYLRKQPSGNLLRAASLGMELIELSPPQYKAMFGGDFGGSDTAPPGLAPPVPGRSLWVPQGGACGMASPGVRILAEEIVAFWSKQGRGMPLSVCVPGGTCSTALLLHREINGILRKEEEKEEEGGGDALDIRVVAVPCVGDDSYAQRQMMGLDARTGGTGSKADVPTILRPLPDSKYGAARKKQGGYFTFGEPATAIMQTFQEMKDEHGLYLDLLYGAPAWSLLLQHWKATTSKCTAPGHYGKKYISDDCPIAGRQVMYVHSGGLEGVSSQLTRYKHKGLIPTHDVQ